MKNCALHEAAPMPRKSINGGEMLVSKWLVAVVSASDSDEDDGSVIETGDAADADAIVSEKAAEWCW